MYRIVSKYLKANLTILNLNKPTHFLKLTDLSKKTSKSKYIFIEIIKAQDSPIIYLTLGMVDLRHSVMVKNMI